MYYVYYVCGVGGGGVEMSPDCFQMISFVDSLSVVCGGVWEEEWEEVGGRRWDVCGGVWEEESEEAGGRRWDVVGRR